MTLRLSFSDMWVVAGPTGNPGDVPAEELGHRRESGCLVGGLHPDAIEAGVGQEGA